MGHWLPVAAMLVDVHRFELFMHLIEQVTQKVTCVLLLHVRIVLKEELVKDSFRIDDSL